jgi:type II secretory pathway component GspD/PulD (secretin)
LNMKIKQFLVGGFLLSSLIPLHADEPETSLVQAETIRLGERRAQAENYYETGLLLYRQQQYEKAADFFRRALSLNPEDQNSKNYLIRVQSVLGVKSAKVASEGDWLEQSLQVRRQEQWAEQRRSMEIANNAYESLANMENLNAAERLDKVMESRTLYVKNLELVKTIDPSEEKRRTEALLTEKIAVLSEMETKLRSEVESDMRTSSRRQMVKEKETDDTYLENRIKSILENAEAECARENFDQCIDLCEDVILIDPKNKKALVLKNKALEARHARVETDTEFSRTKELSRRILKIKDSFVPYSSSVQYPSNWDKSNNRMKTQDQKEIPAWKKKLEGSLDQSLTFYVPGMPLSEVLSRLSEQTGLNIILSAKVTQERDEASLELRELKFEHTKLRYILNWICREVDLNYALKFDTIFVSNKNVILDEPVMMLYDVQDLLSSKPSFAAPRLEDGIQPDGGEIAIQAEDIGQAEPISGDILLEMIQKSIVGAWEENGAKLQFMETGAIFVKNSPQVQEQVVELLQTLRKTSSLQVEVEARNLYVQKGFLREIGVDWSGLNTVDPLNVGTETGFFDRSNDKYSVKGAVLNGLNSQLGGVGFFLEHSILGSFQAKVLLKAIEQDQDVTQLIAPKLVLVNNVLGYIRLGRTQNYIGGYELGAEEGGGGGIQPVIESADEGQLLAVTATISSDRKYITLRLHPDFQEVSIPRVVTITGTQTIATLVGVADSTFSLPLDLPRITKRKIRTTAVIPDDGVLILGGVATSNEDRQDRGVPVLSKIPLLGRLFRSDSRSDSSSDSMLLVHGKIIVFDELEAGL